MIDEPKAVETMRLEPLPLKIIEMSQEEREEAGSAQEQKQEEAGTSDENKDFTKDWFWRCSAGLGVFVLIMETFTAFSNPGIVPRAYLLYHILF